MRKLLLWLKLKIRNWLDLNNDALMGVDVGWHPEAETTFVVVSRGGFVRIFNVRVRSIRELDKLIRHLQSTYGLDSEDVIIDAPYGIADWMRGYR